MLPFVDIKNMSGQLILKQVQWFSTESFNPNRRGPQT